MNEKQSICLDCIYGSQPFCYYPIVCVHGKSPKDMYEDKYKCKHFEKVPEEPEEQAQIPFQTIIYNEK